MNVSSGTKRNYCRAVKRCMAWAKKQGHIDVNPIADLEQPRGGKREVVVTQEEFDQLVALAGDQSFRDLLIVTWETGCRPQESLRVEARHVDLANQRWVFSETEAKTDMPRIVYLTDEALAITRRLVLKYPDGPAVPKYRGKALDHGRRELCIHSAADQDRATTAQSSRLETTEGSSPDAYRRR